MTGSLRGRRSPSTTWMSVRHAAHAVTRTRISPGPGSGTGGSAQASGEVSTGAWAEWRARSPEAGVGMGRREGSKLPNKDAPTDDGTLVKAKPTPKAYKSLK